MAKYALRIKHSAQRELDAALADTPRPPGCKKLKGHKDQWRVRIGDWRVVYIIDDAAEVVSVTRIAHRREVYE